MADQGKVIITMKVTEAVARGNLVDVAGGLTTGRSVGVAIDSIDNAAYGPVQISGTALVIAAGAITAGDLIKSDANGKAVTATAGDGDWVGMALEAATADGQLINCKIY
jgi:hypothetical protein